MPTEVHFSFPIGPSSIVFDLGAHVGKWASAIWNSYQPRLYCFEPVAAFFAQLVVAVPTARCFQFGLAPTSGEAQMSVKGDASSICRTFQDAPTELVQLVSISEFLSRYAITSIGLMKINIEGAEYDLLNHMLSTDLVSIVDHFAIQFHEIVPASREHRNKIAEGLAITHTLTFSVEWEWDLWSKK